jgi:hypothetical protein
MARHGSPPALVLALSLASCGPAVATGDGESTGSGTTSTTIAASTTSTSGTTSTSEVDVGEADVTDPIPEPDVPSCPPLSCGGTIYACTDGLDNDDDSLVDLEDPECVGVCDDDEGAFRFGGPVGIEDCRIDCAFDGNSGSGDDMCITDLRCDPLGPGAPIGCDYQPQGPVCAGGPEPLMDGCRPFCEQFTIPGCDCFGCCDVQTVDGKVSIFIEANTDCRLDNLAACSPCTSRIAECGNPCDACEICIGHTPIGDCRINVCDDADVCSGHDDCECGHACILGCCTPPPPG